MKMLTLGIGPLGHCPVCQMASPPLGSACWTLLKGASHVVRYLEQKLFVSFQSGQTNKNRTGLEMRSNLLCAEKLSLMLGPHRKIV